MPPAAPPPAAPRPSTDASPTNAWRSPELALAYLSRADTIPRRREGEATLVECLPHQCRRILDVGCGDGRLSRIVAAVRPRVTGLAIDFSPVMIARATTNLADRPIVVASHDLADPLASGPVARDVATEGPFDAVVSSFAIHHLPHRRKRSLFAEILAVLRPGGIFLNLEHVASATPAHEQAFWAALDEPAGEDPSNILAPVGDQLGWLTDAGYVEVDCLWRWRELALLVAERPV